MRDIIINPLTLFALLEAVAARPSLVQYGAPKPSRFDEYVTDPPQVLEQAGFHEQLSGSDDDLDTTLNRSPAELAPAHGLRYHDVVYDASSETFSYYDREGGTYYPSAYRAAGHEPSGSLQSLLAAETSSVPSEVVKRSLESLRSSPPSDRGSQESPVLGGLHEGARRLAAPGYVTSRPSLERCVHRVSRAAVHYGCFAPISV
ncbi:hypothetical protein MTO96_031431 [Rhipicephalus appendiculatus]